jgi:hypothetical protein
MSGQIQRILKNYSLKTSAQSWRKTEVGLQILRSAEASFVSFMPARLQGLNPAKLSDAARPTIAQKIQ